MAVRIEPKLESYKSTPTTRLDTTQACIYGQTWTSWRLQ